MNNFLFLRALILYVLISMTLSANAAMQIQSGNWLGKMIIPNGPELSIGLEIFKKADKSWGANVASFDQGSRYIPVSELGIKNNMLVVKLAGAPIRLELTGTEDHLKGEFHQGPNAFELNLSRVEDFSEMDIRANELNESKVKEEEVRIYNEIDDVWLSGTITQPSGNSLSQAVVLIAGSGPSHRDSYFLGHRPFAYIAEHLSQQGFYVLRYDKRGVYKSAGNFNEGDTEGFAKDAESAVRYLENKLKMKPNQIHLIGHSEGSLVAAIVASKLDLGGVISLAGPGVSVLDVLLTQDQTEPRAKGASEKDIKTLLNFSQKFYQTVIDETDEKSRMQKLQNLYDDLQGEDAEIVNQWNDRTGTLNVKTASKDSFKKLLMEDPSDYWSKVEEPVLILNGGLDVQVPAMENVNGILEALKHSSNKVSKVYPKMNHMFQSAQTGSTDEYGSITESFNHKVIVDIQTWLKSKQL